MEITNLSAEPLGKIHSWLPHDLEAESLIQDYVDVVVSAVSCLGVEPPA